MDEMNERLKELLSMLALAGYDAVKIAEVFRQLDETMQILAEETIKVFGALFGVTEESLPELEKRGVFDYEQTARKKKRERDRRRMIQQEIASRFRQHKAMKTAWTAQKRTCARRREYSGPDIVR